MDARKTRIRILNLQDQHCMYCEYRIGPYTQCINNCEIKKEIHQLGKGLIMDEKGREQTTKLKWNQICQQTILWRKDGFTYAQVANRLEYHVNSIRQQLKKRGLLELYRRNHHTERKKLYI